MEDYGCLTSFFSFLNYVLTSAFVQFPIITSNSHVNNTLQNI